MITKTLQLLWLILKRNIYNMHNKCNPKSPSFLIFSYYYVFKKFNFDFKSINASNPNINKTKIFYSSNRLLVYKTGRLEISFEKQVKESNSGISVSGHATLVNSSENMHWEGALKTARALEMPELKFWGQKWGIWDFLKSFEVILLFETGIQKIPCSWTRFVRIFRDFCRIGDWVKSGPSSGVKGAVEAALGGESIFCEFLIENW